MDGTLWFKERLRLAEFQIIPNGSLFATMSPECREHKDNGDGLNGTVQDTDMGSETTMSHYTSMETGDTHELQDPPSIVAHVYCDSIVNGVGHVGHRPQEGVLQESDKGKNGPRTGLHPSTRESPGALWMLPHRTKGVTVTWKRSYTPSPLYPLMEAFMCIQKNRGPPRRFSITLVSPFTRYESVLVDKEYVGNAHVLVDAAATARSSNTLHRNVFVRIPQGACGRLPGNPRHSTNNVVAHQELQRLEEREKKGVDNLKKNRWTAGNVTSLSVYLNQCVVEWVLIACCLNEKLREMTYTFHKYREWAQERHEEQKKEVDSLSDVVRRLTTELCISTEAFRELHQRLQECAVKRLGGDFGVSMRKSHFLAVESPRTPSTAETVRHSKAVCKRQFETSLAEAQCVQSGAQPSKDASHSPPFSSVTRETPVLTLPAYPITTFVCVNQTRSAQGASDEVSASSVVDASQNALAMEWTQHPPSRNHKRFALTTPFQSPSSRNGSQPFRKHMSCIHSALRSIRCTFTSKRPQSSTELVSARRSRENARGIPAQYHSLPDDIPACFATQQFGSPPTVNSFDMTPLISELIRVRSKPSCSLALQGSALWLSDSSEREGCNPVKRTQKRLTPHNNAQQSSVYGLTAVHTGGSNARSTEAWVVPSFKERNATVEKGSNCNASAECFTFQEYMEKIQQLDSPHNLFDDRLQYRDGHHVEGVLYEALSQQHNGASRRVAPLSPYEPLDHAHTLQNKDIRLYMTKTYVADTTESSCSWFPTTQSSNTPRAILQTQSVTPGAPLDNSQVGWSHFTSLVQKWNLYWHTQLKNVGTFLRTRRTTDGIHIEPHHYRLPHGKCHGDRVVIIATDLNTLHHGYALGKGVDHDTLERVVAALPPVEPRLALDIKAWICMVAEGTFDACSGAPHVSTKVTVLVDDTVKKMMRVPLAHLSMDQTGYNEFRDFTGELASIPCYTHTRFYQCLRSPPLSVPTLHDAMPSPKHVSSSASACRVTQKVLIQSIEYLCYSMESQCTTTVVLCCGIGHFNGSKYSSIMGGMETVFPCDATLYSPNARCSYSGVSPPSNTTTSPGLKTTFVLPSDFLTFESRTSNVLVVRLIPLANFLHLSETMKKDTTLRIILDTGGVGTECYSLSQSKSFSPRESVSLCQPPFHCHGKSNNTTLLGSHTSETGGNVHITLCHSPHLLTTLTRFPGAQPPSFSSSRGYRQFDIDALLLNIQRLCPLLRIKVMFK